MKKLYLAPFILIFLFSFDAFAQESSDLGVIKGLIDQQKDDELLQKDDEDELEDKQEDKKIISKEDQKDEKEDEESESIEEKKETKKHHKNSLKHKRKKTHKRGNIHDKINEEKKEQEDNSEKIKKKISQKLTEEQNNLSLQNSGKNSVNQQSDKQKDLDKNLSNLHQNPSINKNSSDNSSDKNVVNPQNRVLKTEEDFSKILTPKQNNIDQKEVKNPDIESQNFNKEKTANIGGIEQKTSSDENKKKSSLILENRDKKPKSDFKINSRLISDIGIYNNYKSTDHKQEFIDSLFNSRFYSNIQINKKLELYSYFRAGRFDNLKESVKRSSSENGGGNRNFENLGVVVPELSLRYSSDKNNSIIFGKFTPDFGMAWRWDRGLWIQNIPGQYKQNEKLGIAGIYRIGDIKKTGLYNFALSFFSNDKTFLKKSLFSQRDSYNEYSNKVLDSRYLSSYNLSTNINFDFGDKEKLSYHFSYLNLAINKNAVLIERSKVANTKGFAAGLDYEFPVHANVELDLITEYTDMKNVDGNSDISDNYFTSSLATKFFKDWRLTVGSSIRKRKQIGNSGFNENLSEINLGYRFDKKNAYFDRITIQVGYENIRTNDNTSIATQNLYGVLVRYYKNF